MPDQPVTRAEFEALQARVATLERAAKQRINVKALAKAADEGKRQAIDFLAQQQRRGAM